MLLSTWSKRENKYSVSLLGQGKTKSKIIIVAVAVAVFKEQDGAGSTNCRNGV